MLYFLMMPKCISLCLHMLTSPHAPTSSVIRTTTPNADKVQCRIPVIQGLECQMSF